MLPVYHEYCGSNLNNLTHPQLTVSKICPWPLCQISKCPLHLQCTYRHVKAYNNCELIYRYCIEQSIWDLTSFNSTLRLEFASNFTGLGFSDQFSIFREDCSRSTPVVKTLETNAQMYPFMLSQNTLPFFRHSRWMAHTRSSPGYLLEARYSPSS